MANEAFKAGEGALWVQPSGPNSAPAYLGCHSVGDVAVPKGDITLLYCPDEAKTGSFKVSGSFTGTPGAVTTTITTKVYAVADYLESLNCPAPIYIVKQKCGRRDVFSNYDRMYVISDARVTNNTISALLAMTPDEEGESQQSFDLSGLDLIRYWKLTAARQSTTDAEAQNDIAVVSEEVCAGYCGSAAAGGATGFVVGDTLVGSAGNTADMLVTTDAGGTWTAGATDPFLGGYSIASIVIFGYGSGLRQLVANGTTQVAAPAQAAYSDDSGATWTRVNVGSTNGQYFLTGNSLYAASQFDIWAVSKGGYVYHSTDAGASWTTKDAGVADSAADLNCVDFVDAQYGAAGGLTNALIRTTDYGTTWSAVAAPAGQAAAGINVLRFVTKDIVWLGYSDGKLFYTLNFQATAPTWTQRSYGVTGIAVNDLDFAPNNSLTAFMVVNSAGPIGHLLRTFDGGYTWESIACPTNAGLNALAVVNANKVYAVGEASGGSGVIIKAA